MCDICGHKNEEVNLGIRLVQCMHCLHAMEIPLVGTFMGDSQNASNIFSHRIDIKEECPNCGTKLNSVFHPCLHLRNASRFLTIQHVLDWRI